MFFSFVKSFSLYRANFDLTKYTRQENYKRKFDLPYVLSPIVGFAATPNLFCRFATFPPFLRRNLPPKEEAMPAVLQQLPFLRRNLPPEKGNNMFFHTSEEESGVCRFAVTSALSPIVGFAATSPEGGSNACRLAIYFRFSGFRVNFKNKFFNYNSKIFYSSLVKNIFLLDNLKECFYCPLPPSGEVAKSSVCEILTIGDLHNLITIIFRKYRYILL